jgi:hypothetical protein
MPIAPFVLAPQGQQAATVTEQQRKAYYFKISAQQHGTCSVINT